MIVKDAIEQLKDNDVELDSDTEENLMKDLMVVVCSDFGKPTPVLNIR